MEYSPLETATYIRRKDEDAGALFHRIVDEMKSLNAIVESFAPNKDMEKVTVRYRTPIQETSSCMLAARDGETNNEFLTRFANHIIGLDCVHVEAVYVFSDFSGACLRYLPRISVQNQEG